MKCLEETIRELIKSGIIYYGAGGARGFDALAALAVIKLRREFPQVKLILVLPCLFQIKGWREEDIRLYDKIMAAANKIVYISKNYTSDCMFQRNRHLVNESGTCICYLRKSHGGTAYTVDYAASRGMKCTPDYGQHSHV